MGQLFVTRSLQKRMSIERGKDRDCRSERYQWMDSIEGQNEVSVVDSVDPLGSFRRDGECHTMVVSGKEARSLHPSLVRKIQRNSKSSKILKAYLGRNKRFVAWAVENFENLPSWQSVTPVRRGIPMKPCPSSSKSNERSDPTIGRSIERLPD